MGSVLRSHFSAGLALFVVLLIPVVSLAPMIGSAQQAVTQPVSAASGQKAAASEQKSAREESDIYRHSATVQKLAKLLNVDVETAARGFEIFNFAIIVFGIGIPLARIMPKMLRARRATLTKSIDDARLATTDARSRLSAVEAKLANLDVEIAAFRTQVESESVGDEARIKATIEEERQRIVAAAGHEIAQAAAQAQRGLRQFAAELAIDRAVSQMELSPAADRERADRDLIGQFASDFSGRTDGGKN